MNKSNRNSRSRVFRNDRNGHGELIEEMRRLPLSFCLARRSIAFTHKSKGIANRYRIDYNACVNAGTKYVLSFSSIMI